MHLQKWTRCILKKRPGVFSSASEKNPDINVTTIHCQSCKNVIMHQFQKGQGSHEIPFHKARLAQGSVAMLQR